MFVDDWEREFDFYGFFKFGCGIGCVGQFLYFVYSKQVYVFYVYLNVKIVFQGLVDFNFYEGI